MEKRYQLSPATGEAPFSWQQARTSITRAILASAMPACGDRLFPCGPDGSGRGPGLGSGLGLAYGAAGVLYALHMTGAGRFPEHEQWLIDRARGRGEDPGVGFYDGLHGIAHTLALLGRFEEALELVDIAAARRRESLGVDLYAGLAGIALNQAYLCDLQEALCTAEIVAERLSREVPDREGDAGLDAGLMYGPSGPALLFVRMFERTGDTQWLDQAERALRLDLRRCAYPCLGRGGVGVLWVLGEFLHYRPDPELAAARGRLDRAVRSHCFDRPGLFAGRAGIIAYLCRERAGGWGREDPDTARQLVALSAQAILAGPVIERETAGEAMPHLSTDLATGMAGVLLAAGAALHDEPVGLPFLGGTPPARPASRPVTDLPTVAVSDNL